MEVEICNCNNIDNGSVSISEGFLNIKYAINGTGKSTISKAILKSVSSKVSGNNELLELKPFKAISDGGGMPAVDGCEAISSVKVFDESYINDFTYQPDELLKGSFDILIRDENYDSVMAEIEGLVSQIKNHFNDDRDIEALIGDFDELSSSFGKPIKKGVHGSSAIAKALKGGNKVTNIPEGLEANQQFIQGVNNVKWAKWHVNGRKFIENPDSNSYLIRDEQNEKKTIQRDSVGQD